MSRAPKEADLTAADCTDAQRLREDLDSAL